MDYRLAAITIYPVKSTAGLAVDDATVEARGLTGDRRFMVVDANGDFITARQEPRLLLIKGTPTTGGVQLTAPDAEDLEVAPTAGTMDVAVWSSAVTAARTSAEADAWISRYLDRSCRLVYMGDSAARPVKPDYSEPGDEVSFADALPVLVISQGSLDDLNGRLDDPISMARFRPNLVIAGCAPHAEDTWQRIRVGDAELALVKPCDRCVLTTLDPVSAMRDPTQEPLRTLATYRRWDGKVWFGQNATPRVLGRIQVGDRVEVLA